MVAFATNPQTDARCAQPSTSKVAPALFSRHARDSAPVDPDASPPGVPWSLPGRSSTACQYVIVMVRSAGEFADLAGLVCAHRLDFAAGQHAGKVGLARAASPGFGQDRRRNHRCHLFRDETHVQRPHAAVVSFASDGGARVLSPSRAASPWRMIL